jgi:hypothetical protein
MGGRNPVRQLVILSVIEHRSLGEGREAFLYRLYSYKELKQHLIILIFGSKHPSYGTEEWAW